MEKIEKTLLLLSFSLMIVLIGALCNFLVVQGNGRMPVLASYYIDGEFHYSISDLKEASYSYFVDRFRGFGHIFSIGDVLLTIGGLLATYSGGRYCYLKRVERKKRFLGEKI